MLCPHCGKEIYKQVTNFINLDNGAACNTTVDYTTNVQLLNVNLAAGCNPTMTSYPIQSNLTFRYDVATGNMTQVQEEL